MDGPREPDRNPPAGVALQEIGVKGSTLDRWVAYGIDGSRQRDGDSPGNGSWVLLLMDQVRRARELHSQSRVWAFGGDGQQGGKGEGSPDMTFSRFMMVIMDTSFGG